MVIYTLGNPHNTAENVCMEVACHMYTTGRHNTGYILDNGNHADSCFSWSVLLTHRQYLLSTYNNSKASTPLNFTTTSNILSSRLLSITSFLTHRWHLSSISHLLLQIRWNQLLSTGVTEQIDQWTTIYWITFKEYPEIVCTKYYNQDARD